MIRAAAAGALTIAGLALAVAAWHVMRVAARVGRGR